MPRQAEQFHILIWKDKEWDYIFLDEAFKYSDWFKWLVWTKMVFHTESEYEEAREDYIQSDDLKYLWKDAVANDATEESFQDWKEEVIDEDNELIYDSSYRCAYWIDKALEIIDKHEYEETWLHVTSEFSDCVWWWRCFDEEMLHRDYWEWVEEENFKKFVELYNEYEK